MDFWSRELGYEIAPFTPSSGLILQYLQEGGKGGAEKQTLAGLHGEPELLPLVFLFLFLTTACVYLHRHPLRNTEGWFSRAFFFSPPNIETKQKTTVHTIFSY